jgi:RNA polymerase sigma factor (sigma-70 family)
MPSHGSVTQWIGQLKAGDEAAAARLWRRYAGPLAALARKTIRGVPRGMGDEEDVVLEALNSVFRCAKEGRFSQLLDREDLWQLMVVITFRKALHLVAYAHRDRRDPRKVQQAAGPAGDDSAVGPAAIEDLLSREPDPALVAELADQCQVLLDKLGDDELRTIVMWKVDGFTNVEIAAQLGCARATVERRLQLSRRLLEKELFAEETTPGQP